MNKVLLCGRLCKDATISQGGETKVARFNLAVDRRYRREGTQREADFPSCVAFGKNADFVEKYLQKGTKILIEGRLQTGNYTNKDGVKVYTTDVICDTFEFVESKRDNDARGGNNSSANNQRSENRNPADDFMDVPEGLNEELPFK